MGRARVILRRIRRIWIACGLFVLVAMPFYMLFSFAPAYVPASALQSDGRIHVDEGPPALAFVPVGVDPAEPGFIFYPGCPVPAESYAPFGRAIAEQGFPAYLMRVPYRCAARENLVQELFRETEAVMRSAPRRWVLGGHSRGGAMASRFAAEHPTALAGLVLEGTTHPRDVDLSHLTIPVVKIVATNDGVAPEWKSQRNARLLPPGTHWVRIAGGNHAQFGYYRFQLWDGRATISRQAQQAQVVDAVLDLLRYGSRTGS